MDVNMNKVLDKLKIKASKETNFSIFDKDKDDPDPGGTTPKPGQVYELKPIHSNRTDDKILIRHNGHDTGE